MINGDKNTARNMALLTMMFSGFSGFSLYWVLISSINSMAKILSSISTGASFGMAMLCCFLMVWEWRIG